MTKTPYKHARLTLHDMARLPVYWQPYLLDNGYSSANHCIVGDLSFGYVAVSPYPTHGDRPWRAFRYWGPLGRVEEGVFGKHKYGKPIAGGRRFLAQFPTEDLARIALVRAAHFFYRYGSFCPVYAPPPPPLFEAQDFIDAGEAVPGSMRLPVLDPRPGVVYKDT